jgi:hypothetical protein
LLQFNEKGMNLQQRTDLMIRMGKYLVSGESGLSRAREEAYGRNNWFLPEFIERACRGISSCFLQEEQLLPWIAAYENRGYQQPRNIGIIMAGNIPLVGFHDLMCCFLAGHRQTVKLSSGDSVLMQHVIQQLYEWNPASRELITVSDSLKGCDAFIATGSNHSARYFDYYFSKYPHIIRHSKTSAAWLTGIETPEELDKLADDINLYFGLGCRNVTKVMTPPDYDFSPLLKAMEKYSYFREHHKYSNNYDYRLAILLLNKQAYLTNGMILITEDPSLFSPIGILHYETWSDPDLEAPALSKKPEIQGLVGHGFIPFGSAQFPGLSDYADRLDTMQFLSNL